MKDNFVLDTQNMDTIVGDMQKIGKLMSELKNDLRHDIVNSISDWEGKGRNMFESKYILITRQLNDMSDEVYEVAEELLKAAETYIQADTDAAKKASGKSNRY